jgi:Anti-sigma-K factor rskA
MSALPNHEQLLDLLAKQVTEGLNQSEETELKLLLSEHPALNGDEFDASVASILLGTKSESEAMPAQLAARILADAPVRSAANASAPNVVPMHPRKPMARFDSAGWWAAAASLLIAVAGWWPRLNGELIARPPVVAALTAEQQRAALLSSGRAIQASWSPGNDAAGNALVGDVVFDPATQKGYLHFRGIPANDPRLEQYQLWIADGARTPPEPVDGGVFNTPQNTVTGDVIIPFEAKLPVGKPAAFVVTVEQPGGVVVSKQERVLALAKVKS